jgi:hypothetical protein
MQLLPFSLKICFYYLIFILTPLMADNQINSLEKGEIKFMDYTGFATHAISSKVSANQVSKGEGFKISEEIEITSSEYNTAVQFQLSNNITIWLGGYSSMTIYGFDKFIDPNPDTNS